MGEKGRGTLRCTSDVDTMIVVVILQGVLGSRNSDLHHRFALYFCVHIVGLHVIISQFSEKRYLSVGKIMHKWIAYNVDVTNCM